MKHASKRYVIISEQVNRYSFRALVRGIDFSQYEKNPVMLWMHNRAFGSKDTVILPIGNVIDLKIEEIEGIGLCITGLPVFDETDEFAMSIYNKLENGTIRMMSAGLIPLEWSDSADLVLHGQRSATLVRSLLEEISVVDIGGDNNALPIALYNQSHERIELSSGGENAAIPLLNLNTIDMSKIELSAARAAILLGGKEVQTAEQFESEISSIVQLAAKQKTQVETLTREKSDLQTELDDMKAVQLNSKVETLVQSAVDARKITADEKASYIALAKADYDNVEKLLGAKGTTPSIQNQIEQGKSENVSLYSKTYDELFKSGELEKVKLNAPTEFARIFKDKFGTEPKK